MPRTNADIGLTLQVRGDKQPPARQQRQNYHTQGTSSRLGCPWLGKPSRFGFWGFFQLSVLRGVFRLGCR